MEIVTLENSITLGELLSRSELFLFEGEEVSIDVLNKYISTGQLTVYDKKDYATVSIKKYRVTKKHCQELSELFDVVYGDKILFDLDEIKILQKHTATSINDTSIGHKTEQQYSAELDKAKNEISDLQSKIVELTDELASYKRKQQTAPAMIARGRNGLQSWKDAVKIMVFVAMTCQEEGPRERSRADLKNLCKRCNGKLTGSQLNALRQALPPGHVDCVDRAVKSTK